MAIRATLECGHSAVLRARTTPEGYTHDWEVFVRGVNNADIHHFIEKVVFHLHETFPKPKRTFKSPPYVVKESGYAGFVIPIHIYLRNKDEPKKVVIQYDLQLQQSGPAINTVIKHNEVFGSPSDEFRKLLLKGGATPVHNSEGSSDKLESKLAMPMTGKPKLSGSETKKHRPTEQKPVNTFAALFGTPIKTGKISPDSKKPSSDKTVVNKTVLPEKAEKMERMQKVKHGQHKDGMKDKSEERKEKKEKEKEMKEMKEKDKEKSKDKHKRTLSPSTKNNHMSPKLKRTISPSPVRKVPSPKRSSSPKIKDKEVKKEPEKEREKEKDKQKEIMRTSEEVKSDRKKEKKRHKEDREKEKKDKHKDKERDRSKELSKGTEGKKIVDKMMEKKVEKIEKVVKEEKKSPKKEYEKKEEKVQAKVEKEKIEKTEKRESKGGEKEKQQKHKHKKKDKKEKRDNSKERERKDKRDKSKEKMEKASNPNPLSTLLAEMPGDDSDSRSEQEDSFSEPVKKKEEEPVAEMAEIARTSVEDVGFPNPEGFPKKEKSERHKKDKTKSRSEERERKKKRKSDSKLEEEAQREMKREKVRENSTSPALEPVSSRQSPVVTENDRIKEAYKEHVAQKGQSEREREQEQVTPDSTNSALVDTENFESLGFSEDYVTQLKELQHKIMTIQDNQELQRVVQVIAETGQYEITKKTFDFDLCALDRRTVQRLQKFFAS